MGRLTVNLAGVTFKNPVMPASGTAAYGQQMAQQLDLSALGAWSSSRPPPNRKRATHDQRPRKQPRGGSMQLDSKIPELTMCWPINYRG